MEGILARVCCNYLSTHKQYRTIWLPRQYSDRKCASSSCLWFG